MSTTIKYLKISILRYFRKAHIKPKKKQLKEAVSLSGILLSYANKGNAMLSKILQPCLMVLVLLLVVLGSFDASAAVDLNAYRQSRSFPPEIREKSDMYIFGLRDGIVLFDGYNNRFHGEKKNFCIENANLNGEKHLQSSILKLQTRQMGSLIQMMYL